MKTETRTAVFDIVRVVACLALWAVTLFFIGRMWQHHAVNFQVLSAIPLTGLILPGNRRWLWRANGALAVIALAWWGVAEYRFGSPQALLLSLKVLAGMTAAGIVVFLLGLWNKAVSPGMKLVVGTAIATVAGIAALLLFGGVAAQIIANWHFLFIEHWDITLIVVYLPLLVVGWIAFTRLQTRKP